MKNIQFLDYKSTDELTINICYQSQEILEHKWATVPRKKLDL